MKRQVAHLNYFSHPHRHQFSIHQTAARKLLALSLVQQHSNTRVIHPGLAFPCHFSEHLGSSFLKKKIPKSKNHSKVTKIMRLGGSKCLLTAVWDCSTPRDYHAFEFVSLKACWDDHCRNRLLQDSINTLLNLVLCRSS